MIISNSKKFIYFHIPKTGGSSLSYNLCKYSENLELFPQFNKLLDYIIEDPEFNRVVANRIVRECVHTIPTRHISDYYIDNPREIKWMNAFHYGFDIHPIYKFDLDIQHIMDRYEGKLYSDYFKFAFVRNPWDYVFSIFKNKIVRPNVTKSGADVDDNKSHEVYLTPENFQKFFLNLRRYPNIKHDYLCTSRCQVNYISNQWDNLKNIDYIARFENYEKEIEFLSNKLYIPFDKTISFNKGCPGKSDYRDFYNDKTRRLVEIIFSRDIEAFNYTFD